MAKMCQKLLMSDRYGEFPTEFPARFPTRFPARFSTSFSCNNFPQDFLQDFPATISHKIFLQQFPTRFSHKIFRQHFLQDFPARFSRKNCWCQHFLPFLGPLQAIKHHQTIFLVEEVLSFDLVGHMWKLVKNWLQEWVFNIYKWKWGRSRWIAYFENYLQKWFGDRYGEFATRFSCKIFLQEFPARISCKNFPQNFPQDFPTRFSHKIFPQDFPIRFSWAGSWLFGCPSPYSKC